MNKSKYDITDSDIINVNIVGNDTKTSIGVLVEGYDNTFTNMRIKMHNPFRRISRH